MILEISLKGHKFAFMAEKKSKVPVPPPISGPNDPRILLREKVKKLKRKNINDMLEVELNKSINGVTRMEGLIARLVSEGIRGNMRAIELILAYLIGKPQNATPDKNDKPFVLELTESQSTMLLKQKNEEEDEADSEAD